MKVAPHPYVTTTFCFCHYQKEQTVLWGVCVVFFFFLALPLGLYLASPTRDQTRALVSENVESSLLGHQGIP